jgi:hypothetical protein
MAQELGETPESPMDLLTFPALFIEQPFLASLARGLGCLGGFKFLSLPICIEHGRLTRDVVDR